VIALNSGALSPIRGNNVISCVFSIVYLDKNIKQYYCILFGHEHIFITQEFIIHVPSFFLPDFKILENVDADIPIFLAEDLISNH
jgi:hypothetical protein